MYYGVKKGRNIGIYDNWADCQEQVIGFSGAIYKKFKTKEEAASFVGTIKQEGKNDNTNNENSSKAGIFKNKEETQRKETVVKYKGNFIYEGVPDIQHKVKDKQVIAYVDGSYEDKRGVGYGSIILLPENSNIGTEGQVKLEGRINKPEWNEYRNVSGELIATILSIEWAVKNNFKEIEIYHDYLGISEWALGNWKAKSPVSQYYKNVIEKLNKHITIKFVKIKAHSGNFYNEVADRLAKI